MAQIHFSRNYPGIVPKAPAIPEGETGDKKYLREDGTWAEPEGGGPESEVDPTVPSWAKQPTKPTYNAEEVGAVDEDDVITTTEINELFD